MAFVTSIPQEEQNQFAPSGQTTANPLSLLPPQAAQTGGSSGQGGAQGGAAPTVGTPTQFGSSASRLSDYLKANQDQVQNMANNVAGNFGTQYGNIQSNINQAGQNFAGQVAGGYTPMNQDVLNQVQANPTEAAKNPDTLSSFQKQLNDAYTGPTNFESSAPYGDVQSQVTNAVQGANLVNNPAGLSTYLQNNVEKNATPGQNTLDTVLLQGNQPAFQTVTNAASQFSNLPKYLQDLATQQNQSIQQAQQDAASAKTGANNIAFGPTGLVPTFQSLVQNQAQTAEQQRQAYNNAINANLSTAQGTQSALNNAYPSALAKAISQTGNLGNPALDAAEKARITGLMNPGYSSELASLQSYLSANPITQPGTLANVSSTGNYQEDAALAQLLGGQYTPLLNQADIGQAGTFSVPNAGGAPPGAGGEVQYLNDLASLYGNPQADYWNAGGGAPGGTNLSPAAQAQKVIDQSKVQGQGINLDAANLAALQRIIGGETGYGG